MVVKFGAYFGVGTFGSFPSAKSLFVLLKSIAAFILAFVKLKNLDTISAPEYPTVALKANIISYRFVGTLWSLPLTRRTYRAIDRVEIK